MTDLTDQQKAAAAMFGMTPEQYVGYGTKHPDVAALEPDPEREKRKQEIREVLAEREAS